MKAPTFQQFRSACAVVDSGFNVSRAATTLHTTQSAVSKTIKGLEDDLGAGIFVRSSVRIVELTDYGLEFIALARGILRDAEIAMMRAQEDSCRTRGTLRIATTHVHARYSLPRVIHAFRSKYPEITVQLEQSDAEEITRSVSSRRVHVGIAGTSAEVPAGLIRLAAMRLERCIAAPLGHPLLALRMPTLLDVVAYPVITYSEKHPAGRRLHEVFRKSGLEPRIVITATDSTVLKEYVAAGMGIAILHKIAVGPEDATKIGSIDADHLFPSTETQLIFRQGEYLRSYVYDFAETFCPRWSRRSVMSEIERQTKPAGEATRMMAH